jgi:hypothetical protein
MKQADLNKNIKNTESQNEIQLRSTEINEILSTPPQSIVRWGSSIILIIMLLLIAGCHIISYPDKIIAAVEINAEKSGNLIAQLYFNPSGAGKVKKGQKAIIRIQGYSYMEYGTIKGIIISVGAIKNSGKAVTAIASLDYPLITNYGKSITYSGTLYGSAEIITKNISLLERMIYPIRFFIKSQVNY